MRKISLSLFLIFLSVTFFFTYSSPAVADENPKVAVALATLNVNFFVEMKKGLEAEAEKQGVDLTVLDGRGEPSRQLSQVENLLVQDFDVIALNPIDAKALIPAAKSLNESGVPWFTLDRFVDHEGPILHAGASAEMGGIMGAKALVQSIEGKGRVIILEGKVGSSSNRERKNGVQKVLQNHPGVEVIAQQPAGFSRKKGLQVMENLLQAHNDFDAIFAYNDAMSLGALEALKDEGLAGEVPLVGVDGMDQAVEAVKNGNMFATVSFAPKRTGHDAIKVALKLLNGDAINGLIFREKVNYLPWKVTRAKIISRETLGMAKK